MTDYFARLFSPRINREAVLEMTLKRIHELWASFDEDKGYFLSSIDDLEKDVGTLQAQVTKIEAHLGI